MVCATSDIPRKQISFYFNTLKGNFLELLTVIAPSMIKVQCSIPRIEVISFRSLSTSTGTNNRTINCYQLSILSLIREVNDLPVSLFLVCDCEGDLTGSLQFIIRMISNAVITYIINYLVSIVTVYLLDRFSFIYSTVQTNFRILYRNIFLS